MNHPVTDVAEFMRLGGQTIPDDVVDNQARGDVDEYLRRCEEELGETYDGVWGDYYMNLPEVVDGFLDLAYVAFTGAIRCAGEEKATQCWNAIVKANASKVDGSLGAVKRDEQTGKILKPEGWTAPDIEGILG